MSAQQKRTSCSFRSGINNLYALVFKGRNNARIMNKRTKRAHGRMSIFDGLLDHLKGSFYAVTSTCFIGNSNSRHELIPSGMLFEHCIS